jgi:NAD kinase
MTDQQDMVLTVDGQYSLVLEYGDRVQVTRSPLETSLIRLQGKNFFDILREKLMHQNR